MYGTHLTYALAPLEYRHALDAAAAVLAPAGPAVVRCDCRFLEPEVRQRFPVPGGAGAIWVEPEATSWRGALAALASALPPGAPLVVVASRPLARTLPERRGWPGSALGLHPMGLLRLRRALRAAGLAVRAERGFHSLVATALSRLSLLAEQRGRPALGDRLRALALQRYVVGGPPSGLSTVAILVFRKGEGYGGTPRQDRRPPPTAPGTS